MRERTGRVTIPTNLDIVPETIELMKRWGADAIRDCDGTEFPRELVETGAKIYATYYTTRKKKTMNGRRKIRMRCSNAISCRLFIRRLIKR